MKTVRGLLQWFLYRDRLRTDGAGRLECRHTHQYDALQGRVRCVCRAIPSSRERRLVDLPQHCHSMAGDFADIGWHQRSDYGRPSPLGLVTLHFTEQLPRPLSKHFPKVFLCAWTNQQFYVDTSRQTTSVLSLSCVRTVVHMFYFCRTSTYCIAVWNAIIGLTKYLWYLLSSIVFTAPVNNIELWYRYLIWISRCLKVVNWPYWWEERYRVFFFKSCVSEIIVIFFISLTCVALVYNVIVFTVKLQNFSCTLVFLWTSCVQNVESWIVFSFVSLAP